jgi:hypothetical protein
LDLILHFTFYKNKTGIGRDHYKNRERNIGGINNKIKKILLFLQVKNGVISYNN